MNDRHGVDTAGALMADEKVCAKLRKLISGLFRKAYDRDFEELLAARQQELWLVGVQSGKRIYTDICGTIGPEMLAVMQKRGFINADAGYLANAQDKLDLGGRKVDLFLLNTLHFSLTAKIIEPLIVHELAHLLEHINEPPQPKGNDDRNADAILNSLDPGLLHLHPKIWALHLAGAGRTLIEKKLTPYGTIQAFLEAAVPEYDRLGEPIRAEKEND